MIEGTVRTKMAKGMDRDIKLKHSVKTGFTTLLTVALLIAGSPAAYSAIYKWQDESGGWHFSEVPPDDKTVQKVDVRVTPPSSTNTATPSDKSPDQASTVTTQVKEKGNKPLTKSKEVAAEDKALRKKNCQIAKDNLTSLQRSRIRFLDEESGEERYLSEEERLKRIENNNKTAAENCP